MIGLRGNGRRLRDQGNLLKMVMMIRRSAEIMVPDCCACCDVDVKIKVDSGICAKLLVRVCEAGV